MYKVRRLTIILITILLFTFFFIRICYADIIKLEGGMNTNVIAYITKRLISYNGTKNLTYKIFLPTSHTEGINTQSISRVTKTFTPYPTKVNEFNDKYGNSGIELKWNKEIKIVQIDLQFNAKIYSNFNTVSSTELFPISETKENNIFLTSTDLSPSNDMYINYVGRSISKGLNREIDVVSSIFLWLDRNIRISNSPEYKSQYDAISVLKNREGSEKGICNLACAIFKGIGIPSRVVYGISFHKEIDIKTPDERLVFNLPNDERYWTEVYFPDTGWIGYSPYGLHFATTSHVIKLSSGPDSDYVTELWSVEQGSISMFKDFNYDIRSESTLISFKEYSNIDFDKIVITPNLQSINLYTDEPKLDIKGLKAEKKVEELQPGIKGMILHNSDISQKLDVVATKNRIYAQKFDVNFPITISSIVLPLIKFGDEGRIWVEIYSDNNGIPAKKLFRTYSISSPKIRFMMIDNPWISFPVGKETNSYLKAGSYWILLRSSGNCIFNWHASEGNVIAGSLDTRYMNINLKKPHWNNLLNFDLNFQIIGKREKEKENENESNN